MVQQTVPPPSYYVNVVWCVCSGFLLSAQDAPHLVSLVVCRRHIASRMWRTERAPACAPISRQVTTELEPYVFAYWQAVITLPETIRRPFRFLNKSHTSGKRGSGKCLCARGRTGRMKRCYGNKATQLVTAHETIVST